MSAAAAAKAETHAFQADVNKVLDLVIHSLYSNKEIFLRELVSNASDALDKLRFRAITEPALLAPEAGGPTLEVRIVPDKDGKTLTIEDTGVGMTHEELVQNLGTVAHSGSQAFLAELAKKKGEDAPGAKNDVALIGQFGVGFYSAYLVADRVEVRSRAAGHDEAFVWASDAQGTYTIAPLALADAPRRGTAIVLHLKKEHEELLDAWRLRELVSRYSDYVGHPIRLGKPGDAEMETVNRGSALWQRPKSEITEEQYAELYRHLTHDFEPPLAHTHFRVEGSNEFVGLLFVPKHRPFDLDAQGTKRRGVRLFVKRVFIMDDCEEVLPQWLRFVRGVVDSDDLPLNVSREILQDSSVVRTIKKQVVKRTLDLLSEMADQKPDDYAAFWTAFGPILKEGLALDGGEHKERIAKLLRYASTKGEGTTSLAEYVARMPEGQPAIYYVYGESVAKLEGSPHLEALKKRGYEALYMTDPVDEWAAEGLREFEGKPLVSVMRANLDLPATDDEKKSAEEQKKALEPFLEHVKKVLDQHVREARVSTRLTDSPCCLVVPEGAPSAYMEKLLAGSGRGGARVKRILEINPTHPVVEHLRALFEQEPGSPRLAEWIELLHDQALLTEGSALPDPNRFARLLTSLLEEAAGKSRTP
jgi:molecular chaperone HtpG